MTEIINSIINPHTKKPGFSFHTEPFNASDLNIHFTRFFMAYTDSGIQTSHYYTIRQNGEITDYGVLRARITDYLTGEILYEFYGVTAYGLEKAMDTLISQGQKFNLYGYNEITGYHQSNKALHKFRQLKSGKWRAA